MSSSSRKPTKRKANTQTSKKKARKRRQVRRGTSPSHMLMSPQEEAKFSTPQALMIPGRVQIDLLLRAGSAMYLKPREVQASTGSHVWVSQEYETTEYTSLDMLRSPFRAETIDKWTPKEIALFEACICTWGKDFYCISQHIQTKTTKEVVEFYYKVWKHSQHYYIWKAHKLQCEQLAVLKEQQQQQLLQHQKNAPPAITNDQKGQRPQLIESVTSTVMSLPYDDPEIHNPLVSLLAPHSKSYAKRLGLLHHMLSKPNPNIPANSPLYSLLPPQHLREIVQNSLLQTVHKGFKSTSASAPSDSETSSSSSGDSSATTTTTTTSSSSSSSTQTDAQLNTAQHQQETSNLHTQELRAVKQGWTRDTGLLSQSIANPAMTPHHLQYHTSSNNPNNPTAMSREGSTSHNIYPSSNPYHLTSKQIRSEDLVPSSHTHPYDSSMSASTTLNEYTGGVPGWSDLDTYSAYNMADLTAREDPNYEHPQALPPHLTSQPSNPTTSNTASGRSNTSLASTNAADESNALPAGSVACEVCHQIFPSPLKLYQHVRIDHYLLFADHPIIKAEQAKANQAKASQLSTAHPNTTSTTTTSSTKREDVIDQGK